MISREIFIEDMRHELVDVSYLIEENKIINFRITLIPSKLPLAYREGEINEEKQWHNENPTLITGWNIKTNSWLTLEVSKIISAQIVATV